VIRTHIQIPEEQSRRLQREARRSGKSVAELIRRSVDTYLNEAPDRASGSLTREAAGQVVGRFRSGKSDIAARHDDYLDEAYGSIQNEDTPGAQRGRGCDGCGRGKDAASTRSGATGATEDGASDRPAQTRRPRLHFESSTHAV
jgi:predicted DNA-binding protein